MIVLDTHTWWWSLSEPERLSENAKRTILETPPYERAIASISIWEFAMMVSRGRINLSIPTSNWIGYAIKETGLHVFELTGDIAIDSCELPDGFHKDPADRIIVSTTRIHKAVLVTKDQRIIEYPHVETIW